MSDPGDMIEWLLRKLIAAESLADFWQKDAQSLRIELTILRKSVADLNGAAEDVTR